MTDSLSERDGRRGHDLQAARTTEPHFLWLRIFLAAAVVFSHFAAISGHEREGHRLTSSTIAVQAFFVISGWIVAASCDRSKTLLGFWLRRFARLYPLYALVVVVQALLGVCFGEASLNPAREFVRYLAVNLVFANFLQPSLFGLFQHAPVQAINPSLWTLKIEALFYAVVPLLVLCLRARGIRALSALYVGSAALFYLAALHSAELGRNFPGQLRFFIAGICCWQLSAAGVVSRRRVLAPIAVVGLWLAQHFEHSYWVSGVQPLFVAAFVYGAAHCLGEPRRMPDISYGLYILHAPLIQFGFWLGVLRFDDTGLLTALLATATLAVCSWYVIEQPAIQLAKRGSERLERRSLRPVAAPTALTDSASP